LVKEKRWGSIYQIFNEELRVVSRVMEVQQNKVGTLNKQRHHNQCVTTLSEKLKIPSDILFRASKKPQKARALIRPAMESRW
jgi:hypothetical protein